MKICLISEEFPPETGWGGIGTYAQILARGLTELGHRVHVIARTWGEDSSQDVDGVQLHRLAVPEPSWRRGTCTLSTHFYATRHVLYWAYRVSQLIRRIHAVERLDIVESPEFHAQGLWTAFRAARIPMVVKLHTPAWLCRRINGGASGTSSRWDTLISEHLEYLLTRAARMITSPSRSLVGQVVRKWRLRARAVRVVPNPVDTDLFCPTGTSPPPGSLLYVGRIERRKGVETLIEAMAQVHREFPAAVLRLVGSDDPSGPNGSSMTQHLRKRCHDLSLPEKTVRFLGPLARAALPEVYRSAAICIVPSLYENLPYTCLEAMGSGCAVVASDAGGIPEIVTADLDGLLVAPGDPVALARSLRRLLADPALLDRLRRRAPETIRDRFGRVTIAKETVRAYETALS
jgi:glycosyltransferase involved in cell wall biosynthesis